MIFTGFSGGTRTSRSTAVIRVGAVLGIKGLCELDALNGEIEGIDDIDYDVERIFIRWIFMTWVIDEG